MNSTKSVALLATVLLLGGCSGSTIDEKVISPREAIRAALDNIAKTGEGGAEVGVILQEVDKLKADDPQLAKSLAKDVEKMMTMTNADQLKSLAKKMLEKIPAASSGGATQ